MNTKNSLTLLWFTENRRHLNLHLHKFKGRYKDKQGWAALMLEPSSKICWFPPQPQMAGIYAQRPLTSIASRSAEAKATRLGKNSTMASTICCQCLAKRCQRRPNLRAVMNLCNYANLCPDRASILKTWRAKMTRCTILSIVQPEVEAARTARPWPVLVIWSLFPRSRGAKMAKWWIIITILNSQMLVQCKACMSRNQAARRQQSPKRHWPMG